MYRNPRVVDLRATPCVHRGSRPVRPLATIAARTRANSCVAPTVHVELSWSHENPITSGGDLYLVPVDRTDNVRGPAADRGCR
jgi:hypothetical protein